MRFFCHRAGPPELWPEATGRGIDVVAFEVGGVAKGTAVEWPKVLERGLCYAYGCWEVLEARRPRPVDVILGRSDGLGSSLFAPVTYPAAPVVQLFDSYYDPSRSEHEGGQPEAFRHWRARPTRSSWSSSRTASRPGLPPNTSAGSSRPSTATTSSSSTTASRRGDCRRGTRAGSFWATGRSPREPRS